jgi:hypothetical protein
MTGVLMQGWQGNLLAAVTTGTSMLFTAIAEVEGRWNDSRIK